MIVLLTLVSCILSQQFILFKSLDQSARCLDGSPAALYYNEGKSNNKFVIYFQGGGLCRGDGLTETIDYCYKRSLTNLGSSKNYPDSRSFKDVVLMSNEQSINPFSQYSKVFIPYCDGSLHQGSRKDPISYKDTLLYFRGSNNTLAHFKFLNQKFNLFDSSDIIISGTSAGGVAAFIWSNYVYQNAKNPKGVIIMPDSGTFITNFPNYYNNKTMQYYTQTTYKLVNQQTKMPLDQCVQKYPSQVQCFQSGNLYQFIKPKVFIIQSQYDTWGLIQILQFKCVPNTNPSPLTKCNDTQKAYIELYREKINEAMKNFTQIQQNGVWSISCAQHGFIDNIFSINTVQYMIPQKQGTTLYQAIIQFKNGKQRIFVDQVEWPYNNGCNGIKKYNLRYIQ